MISLRSICQAWFKPFLISGIKPKGKPVHGSICSLQFHHNHRPMHSSQCARQLATNSTEESLLKRKYVPRRTLMYIPGHDEKKLRKIPNLGVDCAVLECEDGVALTKKAEARENIRKILDELDFGTTDCAVRVNSMDSGLTEEDLQVIFQADKLPQTVLLPKVDTVDDIIEFTTMFKNVTKDKNGYCPYLIVYIETAIGLLNMRNILQQAKDFSAYGIYQLDGVVFGSDDLCADIGASRSTAGTELMYARQQVLLTAKAFRLQAIDMVHIDIKDLDGLLLQSEEGARFGFTGKQIIHPNQIAIVRDAFTPSKSKIDWAIELIQAFEKHQESGEGAFTFHGNMIDMPLLLQAKNIVQMSERTEQAV
ncbi:citramalyl-CoA lyase, mitochondrial-like [Gigantopelta aegis]|uniref:citramalyl-CoA lyase, mitochondrial-like n=1 Tax=Gigantopelta aegis TaxID=1735272 RepID=UPI001B889B4B|nr:citramalyl-CoA lyase, mitochondrial-like [Gigantopelta aegis]